MPDSRPIVELVDELLAARKELTGSIWPRRANREAEQVRAEWPVLVNGQSAECSLAWTLYPNADELRFTICLLFRGLNIWRLDFESEDRIERNPLDPGHPRSGLEIRGPHCHRWEDNRRFATRDAIPSGLPFRVQYDGTKVGPQVWENAFRFFLGQTGIEQPEASEIPPWPKRERFL